MLNKIKVTLVQAPVWAPNLPPLGIAYLSSFLKDKNIDVDIFDFNIELYHSVPSAYQKFWEKEWYDCWNLENFIQFITNEYRELFDSWVTKIIQSGSLIIGFSINCGSKKLSLFLSEQIKQRDSSKYVVFGGPDLFGYKTNDLMSLDAPIDALVVGEGEEAFYELILCKEKGQNIAVPGTIVREGSDIRINKDRALIEKLDLLPIPDLTSFPLEKYTERETIPILSSRGCISKCNYCSDHQMWKRFRYRSSENIFQEISYWNSKGFKNFTFCDLLINGSLKHLESLCELLIQSKIQVFWGGMAIPKFLDASIIKKMKRAGCNWIFMGVESFSKRILKKMAKHIDPDESLEIIKRCHNEGIKVSIGLIVGFPGEEAEDIAINLAVLEKNYQYIEFVSVNPCCINLGTSLYNQIHNLQITLSGAICPALMWDAIDETQTVPNRLFLAKLFSDFLAEHYSERKSEYQKYDAFYYRTMYWYYQEKGNPILSQKYLEKLKLLNILAVPISLY